MTDSLAPAAPRKFSNSLSLYWILLLPVFLGLTLLLHIKGLNSNLIFDDVAIQLYFTNPEFGWIDCLLPLGNGFVRPLIMLLFKVLYHTVGAEPIYYHICAAIIHAAAAATSAVTFCVIVGAYRRAGFLIGLSVTMASAAFPGLFMLSNTVDSMIAIAAMLLISQWALWLRTGHAKHLVFVGLAVLMAFGGKESGVAIGGIIILQTWMERPARSGAWLIAGLVFVVCVVYAILVLKIQGSNEDSYANAGWVSYSPIHMFHRTISNLGAVFFPGTFIMEPLIPAGKLTATFTVLVRLIACGFLLTAVWVVIRRKADPLIMRAAMFYCAGAGMLLPTAMLTLAAGPFSPIGRFLYSAIPLSMLAAGCLLMRWWPARRALRYLLIGVWFAWLVMQVGIVRKSPGTNEYYETAREWKHFVSELARLSPEWPPMQAVTVYTGPPHGSRYINEGYGLAIFRIYSPYLLAAYFSNRTIPETTRAYVFDGKKLIAVPILPPGQ